MSFILEALKKSEQQRHQKNTPQQKVCKRTLALPSKWQGRWPYCLLMGFFSLLLLCSWWFYDSTEPSPDQATVLRHTPQFLSQGEAPRQPLTKTSAAATEAAPVPIAVTSSPPAPVGTAFVENNVPAVQLQRSKAGTSERRSTDDKRFQTVDIKHSMLREVEHQTSVEVPLYLDLTRGLRDQMPRLAMSMHYYIADPDRRMVRINDLILHEGDWVGQGLQIVEITQTGATLDFMGKLFEMRSSSR